jgi:outer membrane receptor protein involved in Fe transport
LKEVEVTAMRDMVQKTEEGFVVNASDNITQIGGTAADLLKNMPGVIVDAEGQITIRGRTPLTLINGRVSGIAGVDRAAQLDRIPASSIEKIEIINNPSAKYDADAEGGVINIVLKKNEDNGTNGAFAIGAGFGDRYRLNASALLNHRTSKLNIGLAYDNWYTTRTRRVQGDRTNYELPDEYFLTQRRFDERLIFYQNAKATLDYSPNKKNNISFEALWAFPGEDNNETLKNINETLERAFTNGNKRHSNEIRRSHAVEFSLNYTKKFKKPDKLLSATLSNTFSNDKENTDIDTQYLDESGEFLGDSFLQRTHIYQKTNLTNISVDHTDPIGKNATIDVGVKSIFRYLNADFQRTNLVNDVFVVDPLNTNIFIFDEQIHAVYGQYTGWTGERDSPKWKYNIGLRAEQVWNEGRTRTDVQKFTNKYFNFFPSANFFYYTQSRNNFKFGYSRRITRPGLGQLNPFTDITDSLNQRAGNPKLKPELIHSFELGYTHALDKASITLTTFYRIRNNAILPYTILDENNVAFTQPLNFGNAISRGAEVIATIAPLPAWSINFSFSAYELQIDGDDDITLTNEQINWYTKLINNLTLFKDTKVQVIASYASPVGIPQGQSLAVYFVDLGLQQKVLRGKGRIGLSVTDIFNTQKYGFITSDYNFSFTRAIKLDTRAVMLTLGYTFRSSFKENVMENRFKND